MLDSNIFVLFSILSNKICQLQILFFAGTSLSCKYVRIVLKKSSFLCTISTMDALHLTIEKFLLCCWIFDSDTIDFCENLMWKKIFFETLDSSEKDCLVVWCSILTATSIIFLSNPKSKHQSMTSPGFQYSTSFYNVCFILK